MINMMLQGRQPIIYEDGNQKRCFFVQDDIDCMKKLAFQDNWAGEVVNIGSDEELSDLCTRQTVVFEESDIPKPAHFLFGEGTEKMSAKTFKKVLIYY